MRAITVRVSEPGDAPRDRELVVGVWGVTIHRVEYAAPDPHRTVDERKAYGDPGYVKRMRGPHWRLRNGIYRHELYPCNPPEVWIRGLLQELTTT